MSRKKWVALAAFLLVAAACGSSSKSSSSGSTATTAANKDPFTIVAIYSVGAPGATGQQAKAAVTGVKAGVDVINKAGGIDGHPVKLEIIDDAGSTTTGVGALQQRLQSGSKVNLIIPGSSSTTGVAYVPIATANNIVSIGTPSALSLNDPAKYPLEFQAPPSQREIAKSMYKDALAAGYKKAAGISSKDAFGTGWAEAAKAASTDTGLPTTFETYTNTDLDLTAPLQRLKASNPDVLLVEGFGEPVGHVLDAKVKLGWDIPVLCDSTCGVTPLVTSTLVGTPQEKDLKVQVPLIVKYTPPEQRTGALKTYFDALKAQGPIIGLQNQISFQYDSVMIIAAAAEQAHSIDSTAIAKALENLKQPSEPKWVTLKEYHFSATNHAATGSGSDYVLVTPTHVVDGQIGAPGA